MTNYVVAIGSIRNCTVEKCCNQQFSAVYLICNANRGKKAKLAGNCEADSADNIEY
jgi:hypothetical protein